MTDKTKKTIEAPKKKANAEFMDGTRMPSITCIAAMLDDLGIKYSGRASQNTVEHKSAGNRYVNSRRDGKEGYKIELEDKDGCYLGLDTSDSYYSYNTSQYARKLLGLAEGN